MERDAVNRRTVIKGVGATAGLAAAGGVALSAPTAEANTRSTPRATPGVLVFDPADYTELTESIADAAGMVRAVTYRFYAPRTYVTNPSDATYQSLVVSVPVTIDGRAVDAENAPIVLANSVGGYMPSSVATATGVGQAGMAGPPGGGGTGGPPTGGGTRPVMVNLAKLALAAGFVVVEPGARGRSLVAADGTYYGTAPAVIVDLKAAVRYVRANRGRLPGDTDRIVSTGVSAGGAVSALLGASGDSPLYNWYLKQAGAADASDAIFATGAWCPITDLEHADGAYEWNWGTNVTAGGTVVDQTLSAALKAQFAGYQDSLKLDGLQHFGRLSAANYGRYLLEVYLQPSATRYLAALTDADRAAYLAANPFITWSGGRATFTWPGYLSHVGARKKGAPSFDAFDLTAAENNEFGAGTVAARHFTAFGQAHDTTGLGDSRLDADIPEKLNLMNPMYHLRKGNPKRSKHWWIRLGTNDTDTSHVISANLAAAAKGLGDTVDHEFYWDQGHGANTDPAAFLAWIGEVSGRRG